MRNRQKCVDFGFLKRDGIDQGSAGIPAQCRFYDIYMEGIRILVEAGASVLGGCCGTTPSYIAAAKEAVGTMHIRHRKAPIQRYLTSERKCISFDLNDPFMIIGERINPTGKKKLQAQLKEGSMDMVSEFAEEQEACGASVLDINMGMSGIDEKAMMLTAICPLQIPLLSYHIRFLRLHLRRVILHLASQ